MFGIGSTELPIIIVLLAAVAAKNSSLQLPNQFSLRTLLIATTIIAMLLGLVAYATR